MTIRRYVFFYRSVYRDFVKRKWGDYSNTVRLTIIFINNLPTRVLSYDKFFSIYFGKS